MRNSKFLNREITGARILKKILLICLVFLFIFLFTGIAFYIDMSRYIKNPIQDTEVEKIINILPGEQFNTTLDHLTELGIVKSPARFRLLARLRGYDKRIKVGEYRVSTRMSPEDVLRTLVSGRSVLYRFTVPEGYNLDQIGRSIEQNGWGDQDAFLLLAKNREFIEALEIEAPTLEGYLFPETYLFPKNISLKETITSMVARFKKVFNDTLKNRAVEMGFSVHQVVTLASIIEKETGDPVERPIISSVFHNRLKKRMRLESDPTVIYGIKNFNGNITRKDLLTPTPYNTYKINGLPPGPIASPGQKSIEAVLYPADTKFLFFVSKKNGTHHFSQTISEHRKAVRKYQLSR